MVGAPASFAERLRAAVSASDSLLCLGLDPDGPGGAAEAERQCLALIEATADTICAVKANLAFFEQHGSAGYAVLERLRQRIPDRVLLILDGKRGDIGSTSGAYARALFDVLGADAITVNPLMGADSVAPFLDRRDRGVFLLARTSNPGAADFLAAAVGAPESALFERIVDEALSWPAAATLGFVVGATAAEAISAVRRRAPGAPLLIPGLGAQGGSLEAAVAPALEGTGGAIFPVSRGISHAPDGPAAAARALRDAINDVRHRG